MTVVEDAFRRVLAARLPAGPGWTAWIDGTLQELGAAIGGVIVAPEDAAIAAKALTRYANEEVFEEDARRLHEIAGRLVAR